jgi:negative regulator of sigma E activity
MTYEENNEIERDPELAAALRLVEPEPPFAEVDWEALRLSVVARAELPLARRRTRSARLSRWTRPLVPLTAAASVALALWFTGQRGTQQTTTAAVAHSGPAAVAPSVTPEDVFQADVSEQEFQNMVSGRANPDALLLVAIGES